MTDIQTIYARLAVGSRFGWLRLLAEGWQFTDPTLPEPMASHHGEYAILMVRPTPGMTVPEEAPYVPAV